MFLDYKNHYHQFFFKDAKVRMCKFDAVFFFVFPLHMKPKINNKICWFAVLLLHLSRALRPVQGFTQWKLD